MPLKYKVFVWRQKMGLSYNEAMHTPEAVMDNDLDMLDLQLEYSKPKETKPNSPQILPQ